MGLIIGLIVLLVGVLYVGHLILSDVKESQEPLYPKFQKTHFQANRNATKEYCPICRGASHAPREHNKTTTLCNSCLKLVYDRSVLREFKIPPAVAKTCQGDQIVALNLIKIDLQRGHISEEEAARLSKNAIREMTESKSKYREVKERMQRLGENRVQPWMMTRTIGESETCCACGLSCHGDCKCLNDFHVDYGQGNIPPRLRAISQKALENNKPEIGFWLSDWQYLKMITDDLEQGEISESEAENARSSYIEAVYEDAKQRLERYD